MNTTKLKLQLLEEEGSGALIHDIVQYIHEVLLDEVPADFGEYAKCSQQIGVQLSKKYHKQLKQKYDNK